MTSMRHRRDLKEILFLFQKKTIPSSLVKYIYFFLLFFWGKIFLLGPYYLKASLCSDGSDW